MNWDDLRLFLALARNGRVSIAAKNIGIDPTTLIRRIKRLEESLDTSLFELTSKGYVLTDAGQHLAPFVEKAEQPLLDVNQQLTGKRTELSGSIRVSVSEGFGSWFLAPLLVDFHHKYPDISVELVATSGFLNLTKREADLAILLERPSKGLLFTKKLTQYGLRLYAQKDYLQQHPVIRSMRDLQSHSLISYIPQLVYAPQLRFIEEASMAGNRSLKSSSINAQHQMIAAGAGIGILPCFIADQDSRLTSVLPNSAEILRSFWLATHRDMRKLARIQVFIDWLVAQVAGKQALLTGNYSE